MTTPASNSAPGAASDDPTFVHAISLIASLEGQPAVQTNVLLLASLGMARAELTDYGHRVPRALQALHAAAAEEGLIALNELLATMLEESTNLAHTLRIQGAQRILDVVVASPRPKQ